MVKPTLLQTILNLPSQSYVDKVPQEPAREGHLVRTAAERIIATSGGSHSDLASSSWSGYRKEEYGPGSGLSMGEYQGSIHPSHAHRSPPSSTASSATLTRQSLPPLPPKDNQPSSAPTQLKPRGSRNITDSAFQQQPRAVNSPSALAPRKVSPGLLSPNPVFTVEDSDDDEEEEGSVRDVFYTPNSSPRASLASSVSLGPMSFVTATTTAPGPRKVSRRDLRNASPGSPNGVSYQQPPKDDTNNNKSLKPSSPISTAKATTAGRSPGTTEPAPASSRTFGARTLPSPPPPSTATRIAVPSTRTPSRSNSLNKGRPSPGEPSRSGPSLSSSPPATSSSPSKSRAAAAVSMASSGSSMSSNSLEGHSVVFSDLTTDATRATSPASPTSDEESAACVGKANGNSPKKANGSSTRVTTTPNPTHRDSTATATGPSGIPISSPRKRPTKSHTYNGLGLSSSPSSSPNTSSPSSTATLTTTNPSHPQYRQNSYPYQYQYPQRTRGESKTSGLMMSMTAVLEAAEEEESYRHGKKRGDGGANNGGVGSSAWKASQLLKQHRNGGKRPSVVSVVGATDPSRGVSDARGKGKERADSGGDSSDGRYMAGLGLGSRIGGVGGKVDKGKGKERDYPPPPLPAAVYTKHQPLTSSPLAISSGKPLPLPSSPPSSSSPPPRNNSFTEISKLLSIPTRPRLGHRRSRSLGAEGMPRYQRSPDSSLLSLSSNNDSRANSPGSSASQIPQYQQRSPYTLGGGVAVGPGIGAGGGGHARAYSATHASSSATVLTSPSTSTHNTVDLSALPQSTFGELPSKGTQGYSNLLLPRAPPPLNLNPDSRKNNAGNGGGFSLGKVGDIDLTRDGLAQTTMASVEVVRGLGGLAVATNRKGLIGKLQLPLVRRKTVPANVGNGHYGGGTGNGAGMISQRDETDEPPSLPGWGVGADGNTSVLGFTSHRKPPEYVPSGSVLVQVWAVGVDGVDGKLIGVRSVQGGSGGGGTGAGVTVANGANSASGSNGTMPPSPAVTTSTEQDSSAGTRGEELEDSNEAVGKPKKTSGGLGRSLSLRERISRSVSLGRSAGKEFQQRRQQRSQDQSPGSPSLPGGVPQPPEKDAKYAANAGSLTMPGIGHVPGRSFVGRVVECGWEVRDEVVRKGDWVAGLLDIKKCGGLTEFIVVDRHRVHRVPHPQLSPTNDRALSALIFAPPATPATASSPLSANKHTLTLEELALIPLCGVPAYRAVRTFMYAFSSMRDNPSISSIGRNTDLSKHRPAGHDPNTPLNLAAYGSMISRLNLGDHENGRRRRALVLRGHDGIGAMAVQMLVLRGWRVCVHVPFIASPPNVPTTPAIADGFMEEVEERIRRWGAEEVIFDDGEVVGADEGRGAAVRVVDGLREDGDVFDAVLDTIGGKDVREAAERLLRSPGRRGSTDGGGARATTRGMGQFTTVVGDNPERAIPSAGDLFRAGIRSLKFSGGGGGSGLSSPDKTSSENVNTRGNDGKGGKVGYAWINISQDVDWEGKDVRETVGSLVELALDYGIKPWVGTRYAKTNGIAPNRRPTPPPMAEPSSSPPPEKDVDVSDSSHWEGNRVVPFEKAPDVFVCGGPLKSGGTVVVRIAS